MRHFLNHAQQLRCLLACLLPLGASAACFRPEPVLGSRHDPRNVPAWYSERSVDPSRVTLAPELVHADGLASDEVGDLDHKPAGQASAKPTVPASKPEVAAATEPVPPAQDKGVPFKAVEQGEPEAFPGLPFEVPPIPAYRKPGPEDCDWIIQDGVARSRRALPDILASDHEGYLLGPVYQASREARRNRNSLAKDRPVTIGVMDDAGEGVLCGGWSVHSPRSVFSKNSQGTFEDVAIEIVGLSESCEVSISWDTRWGQPKLIGLFNIGIRGRNDSFIIRANAGVDRLIIDGCWWLPNKGYAGTNQRHASGMHIDRWGELIWRNHRWRGERPGTPGINLREHSAYLKSARVGTWIVGNDLRGGNRTGFQIRPEPAKNEIPVGPIVIANNVAAGYGWNNGSDPSSYDGGSCITVWTNPNDSTYVFGNSITDAKYGCLTITAQGPENNWTGADGFPIGPVFLAGNTFENRRGDRDPVAITACQEVHLYPNEVQGRFVLNNAWGMRIHGIANGPVLAHDPVATELDLWTWNLKSERLEKIGKKTTAKWIVAAPTEPSEDE